VDLLEQQYLEQLQLALDWGREPWNGVSPRCLTKSVLKRTLPRPRGYNEILHAPFEDPEQIELRLKGGSNGS